MKTEARAKKKRGQPEPGILADTIKRAAQAAKPEKIVLFGSAARGTSVRTRDTIPTEAIMKKPTLKSLEKRVADLEERVAQLEPASSNGIVWKDWRKAVASVERTELAVEVDEAGRKIRAADRRKARR